MLPLKSILATLPLLLFAHLGLAASVEVVWQNPEKYSDIKPDSSDTNESLRKRLFSQLEGQLSKLAERLPEQQVLKVHFTDVRLAGKLRSIRGGETRRVIQHNVYPARLEFDWKLTQENGTEVKSGHERTSSTTSTLRTAKDEGYGIEKMLLVEWFDDTFK